MDKQATIRKAQGLIVLREAGVKPGMEKNAAMRQLVKHYGADAVVRTLIREIRQP